MLTILPFIRIIYLKKTQHYYTVLLQFKIWKFNKLLSCIFRTKMIASTAEKNPK